ncbi:hypothetical protein N403_03735 [Helicobacter pylori FD430]|nr:hypothetical protein N403_03735 [Helicobacter pylori FD430]
MELPFKGVFLKLFFELSFETFLFFELSFFLNYLFF